MSSSSDAAVRTHTPAEADVPAVPLATLLKSSLPTVATETAAEPVKEIGGRKDGPEPTRYGDWEKNGRCIDF